MKYINFSITLGSKPDIYFWRSHDGLEVDVLIHTRGKIYPIEIKLTSTPNPHHLKSVDKFKKLAGNEAAKTGVIICRVDKEQLLPNNNLAIPWFELPAYLEKIIV